MEGKMARFIVDTTDYVIVSGKRYIRMIPQRNGADPVPDPVDQNHPMGNRKWTKADLLRLKDLVERKMPWTQIARELGRTRGAVKQRWLVEARRATPAARRGT
jgi:hypothetical protein